MTVILEEMDPSQLGETFKDRFKSLKPINESIDGSSAEMDFGHDDEEEHKINVPLDFKKINEILDSRNLDYNSHRSNFGEPQENFGSP